MDIQTLGKQLRDRRRALGKTQAEVALAVGISRATLIALENGNGLSLEKFTRLAQVLGLEVSCVESDFAEPAQAQDAPISDLALRSLRKKRFPVLQELLLLAAADRCA